MYIYMFVCVCVCVCVCYNTILKNIFKVKNVNIILNSKFLFPFCTKFLKSLLLFNKNIFENNKK